MKKILVINLGWEQEPMLDLIDRQGLEIYGIHFNDNYYKVPSYKDVLVSDLRNLTNILEYADKIRPDAVISDQCDYSHFAQSCVVEQLGLPGPHIAQAQISANKYLQRMRCNETGILVPEIALCQTKQDVMRFIGTVGLPIILKPTDNRGSFGVNKVETEGDIQNAFLDAIANSHSRLVLAEEFVSGVHVTVDGYAFPKAGCRSLGLASKKMIGTRRQVALDILYPGEIEPWLYEKTMRISEEVCKKLGYRFGMTHCEYMLTEDGEVYLIEAANRGGGVYTSEIICPVVSGINLVKQYVLDSLGNGSDLFLGNVQQNRVILKFFSFRPGLVKEIRGIKEVINTPGVLKFRLSVTSGQNIEPITTDGNRHGFVIYKGQGDIREEVENILGKVEVCYE